MISIRKNDLVQIRSGNYAKKQGEVLHVIPAERKIVVKNIMMVTQHKRRSEKHPKGARIRVEVPIDISKVMLICQSCNKPTKVKVDYINDPNITKKARKKIRLCRKCNKPIKPEE